MSFEDGIHNRYLMSYMRWKHIYLLYMVNHNNPFCISLITHSLNGAELRLLMFLGYPSNCHSAYFRILLLDWWACCGWINILYYRYIFYAHRQTQSLHLCQYTGRQCFNVIEILVNIMFIFTPIIIISTTILQVKLNFGL